MSKIHSHAQEQTMEATVKTRPTRVGEWYGEREFLTSYDVYLDGTFVGNVRKEIIERVSRTTKQTYYDLCWGFAESADHPVDPRTTDERRDTIRLCLQNIGGVPFKVAEALAEKVGSRRN